MLKSIFIQRLVISIFAGIFYYGYLFSTQHSFLFGFPRIALLAAYWGVVLSCAWIAIYALAFIILGTRLKTQDEWKPHVMADAIFTFGYILTAWSWNYTPPEGSLSDISASVGGVDMVVNGKLTLAGLHVNFKQFATSVMTASLMQVASVVLLFFNLRKKQLLARSKNE